MYKFETHLHTNNCSACAKSSPKEMVDSAAASGYSGIVITNHFYHGNTCVDRNLPWEEFVDAYQKDYETAKNYGKEKGIQVFFGIEEGFAAGREMLIYGLSPKSLKNCPEFIMMSTKEKSDFVHRCGGVCVCAHPFRSWSYVPNPDIAPNPDLFDGIEGFNLCNNPQENEKAFVFAVNNKKFVTSGSDTHNKENFGNAGIAFTKKIRSYADFVKRLKSGDFTLIYPENEESSD